MDKNVKAGKNVRVAVRVRPFNEIEMAEKARCAVTANSGKRTIAVVDRGYNKEFGPFDKVYGPNAKQLDIYFDLVEPLVKNVLAGYNCTLFAYGQTSTGKTFTMEGDQMNSDRELAWNENSSVGIIPRALQHIFTELENQDVEEFSVRVSYVELYNEELYDLLSNAELGHARLRLFEDSVRKGSVIVSGLEEVPVADRLEVRELLKKGAEKRRTAATQMNLNSSRSHTVFTITVVIRENSVSGEEVIKQGKLSLIDLAGSENIGRSGSIDKRAREAGSINQSLLTLGRVIMALTSGAGHVPYRESKLTRILQDSLGGKTITTIVATLSPASTNTEESVSTLEYASTAKNIKNQPEINQKLTHRALLKAYNDEMNRLMRDLQAARDKTGFFVDRQNYEDMNTQLAQKSQQIEALTDELQSVLERVQLLMEDAELMNKHYGRLYERYKHMEEKYKSRCDENAQLSLELADCKWNLETHRRALGKLQESADRCRAENRQLREDCIHLAMELGKTHDKIDVLRSAANENEKIFARCAESHLQSADELKKGVKEWNDSLQFEMKTITECCERTRKDVENDIHVFRNLIESLQSKLANYFVASENGSTDSSVFNFLKTVDRFAAESQNSHVKLLDRQNKFADFVINHIKNYERLVKNFCAVRDHYNDSTVALKEELKRRVLDALEAYDKKIEEQRQQTDEQLILLKTEQESLFSAQRSYVKEVSDATASDETLLEALRNDFSKKVTLQKESSNKIHSATKALCGDLKSRGKVLFGKIDETTRSNSNVAERQMMQSGQTSSSLLKEVEKAHCQIKDFVERDIVRPPNTGNTPVRKKQESLPEPVEIPNASELIKEDGEGEAPRRLSHFRQRDSILETPFVVLSPGALKESLKGELEDIHEAPENENDSDISDRVKAVNITQRRRAFQNRNS